MEKAANHANTIEKDNIELELRLARLQYLMERRFTKTAGCTDSLTFGSCVKKKIRRMPLLPLTMKQRRKIDEEIPPDPDIRKQNIQAIREWICRQPHLPKHMEKKREKERDELWKKLNELEVERRGALTTTSNTPVSATTAPVTRDHPRADVLHTYI